MAKVQYYTNRNGKVQQGVKDVPDEFFNFENVLSELFSGSSFPTMLTDMTASAIPPRSNKNHCDVTFPPSSAWVDPKTKEIKIVLAANDVMDDEYRVDLDDDTIIVTFNRKREEDYPIYDWKGLRFVKDEVAKFKFDQRFHDASTTEVKMERGCLFITMQPREEVKPIRKTLAGGLKPESVEQESVEPKLVEQEEK